MPGLRDVAQSAGVSVATAWRVASGSDGVRPETRVRVEAAMRELLYVPPTQRPATGVIGLLLPQLRNPIFPALAQAMETRATAAGLASILCNTAGSPDRERAYVQMLLQRQVDGMVFISSEIGDTRGEHSHYRRLLGEGARLVFVNDAAEDLEAPSVGVDPYDAGRAATQHLIDLGHQRIAYVGGPSYFTATRAQYSGYLDALSSSGQNTEPIRINEPESTFEGGAEALVALLDSSSPIPTGAICNNDLMAVGMMHALSRRGLTVPADMSIVGFDGIDLAGWTHPRLTTMEQPVEDIASTAIEALRTMISEPTRALPRYSFRARLRLGESTGPPVSTRTAGSVSDPPGGAVGAR